jgi:uncharacterized small protein (DUF1192 family)
MATKIKVDIGLIAKIFPEANKIPFLPRKKKKALKKKISKQLISLLEIDAKEIMERVNLLREELLEGFVSLKSELNRLEDC